MTPGAPQDDYDLSRLNVAASPLFLRDAEVMRGVRLLLLGQSHLLRSVDAALKEAGIGRAHYRLLGHVVRWPGLSMADLVDLTGISKQALSRVARDLEKREFLVMRENARDRRRRELVASDAGVALVNTADALLRATMAEAYGGAGQAAVTGFWRVMEGLLPVAAHAQLAALSRKRG